MIYLKHMKVLKNKSLKDLNQYGINAKTKYLIEISNENDVEKLLKSKYLKEERVLILGEGNNILFVNDFNGTIIRPVIKGKEIIKEDKKNIWIKVFCNENWDKFVRWCVKNNYQGVENMVDIPGNIGGVVSQSAGAYGQNIMDVVESVEAVNLKTGERKIFTNSECRFSYRSSIFKTTQNPEYLIVSVIFKLNKDEADTKLNYKSVEEELKTFAKEPYTISDVMQAVINQRKKKLPSIKEYGTCGCVFENPVVTKKKYLSLSKMIPNLMSYPIDDKYVKLPAGRIIDELGWRGKWEGNAGVYENHALCVVTNRKASGEEIYKLTEKIRKDVKDKYDIDLKYEINIIK